MLMYVNLLLGLLIVGYFLVGRKTVKPAKLNLKAKSTSSGQDPLVLEPEKNQKGIQKHESVESASAHTLPQGVSSGEEIPVRSLSVLFMYNGHDWEAHQILDVPQGASMHQITTAYQELIKKSDPSSFEFYEAAYTALSLKHKKHRL